MNRLILFIIPFFFIGATCDKNSTDNYTKNCNEVTESFLEKGLITAAIFNSCICQQSNTTVAAQNLCKDFSKTLNDELRINNYERFEKICTKSISTENCLRKLSGSW